MASQANVYASVAGTVGRSDKDKGAVGVFRRPAETGVWEHVISELRQQHGPCAPDRSEHRVRRHA